jgi:hypothetical protein
MAGTRSGVRIPVAHPRSEAIIVFHLKIIYESYSTKVQQSLSREALSQSAAVCCTRFATGTTLQRRADETVKQCARRAGIADLLASNKRFLHPLPGYDSECAANGRLGLPWGELLLIVLTGVVGLAGLVALLLSVLGLFPPERGPRMRRAFLVLPAAVLVLTACGGAPKVAASHHAAVATTTPLASATTALSPGRSPSPSPTPVIADTALDVATCQEFAAERAGQMNADQFNVWLLQNGGQTTIGPNSSTGMDDTLSTNLGDWYVVQATRPSGDLQPASYYAAEVGAECLSIGA